MTIARLLRVRGNRGELSAIALSDHPRRFEQLRKVFLGDQRAEFEVESVWLHQGRPVFKFRGVDTISDAKRLAGSEVSVPASERLALPEGEFYQSDLIGCEMFDRAGELVGVVTGWQEFGGPPLLEVKKGERELLIPFAKSICVAIDLPARRLTVELPEGLGDL